MTALINTANLARTEPVVYVMEDVHWIDEVSESLMADVLAVTAQTPTMVLITYRPEYQGALSWVHGAQTIALTPLTDSETSSLIGELLGPDPSVGGLASTVVSRVGGNPIFAEEMVRELAQRGVLDGERGGYVCRADVAEVNAPATVQATIGARIDRLDPPAKCRLSAAVVIGLRFRPDLLTNLGVEPVLDELVQAELIDQARHLCGARQLGTCPTDRGCVAGHPPRAHHHANCHPRHAMRERVAGSSGECCRSCRGAARALPTCW
jgi:predicted ATPase